MRQDDCLRVQLPEAVLGKSVSQLLELVFPPDEEARTDISGRFDLRANPDLPEIYAVLLAVCEEWRDWRCALRVSLGDVEVELDAPVSSLVAHTLPSCPPLSEETKGGVLSLHLEQRYCPLEYAVRHGYRDSREGLLDWMRSLTALYFLDKHEALIEAGDGQTRGPAMARAVGTLLEQGLIGLPEVGEENAGEEEEEDEDDAPPRLVITPEGRRFIAGLLVETESYIGDYDHYQDTLAEPGLEVVEFGAGRGVDLRVQAFLADELDPVRTVFLLRLYDGTLDSRLRDWETVMESDEFFEAVLEPVVNRDGVSPGEMERVMDSGHAWLEEREEQQLREAADRDLLRRAGGGETPSP